MKALSLLNERRGALGSKRVCNVLRPSFSATLLVPFWVGKKKRADYILAPRLCATGVFRMLRGASTTAWVGDVRSKIGRPIKGVRLTCDTRIDGAVTYRPKPDCR
jgi:hypothetical protein